MALGMKKDLRPPLPPPHRTPLLTDSVAPIFSKPCPYTPVPSTQTPPVLSAVRTVQIVQLTLCDSDCTERTGPSGAISRCILPHAGSSLAALSSMLGYSEGPCHRSPPSPCSRARAVVAALRRTETTLSPRKPMGHRPGEGPEEPRWRPGRAGPGRAGRAVGPGAPEPEAGSRLRSLGDGNAEPQATWRLPGRYSPPRRARGVACLSLVLA